MPALYSHPFYRLLHELSSPTVVAAHHESPSRRAFSPNFDVRETKDAYILEGELPGLSDKSQVHVEFTDAQTLLVKGRIERSCKSSFENKASDTESSLHKSSSFENKASDTKSSEPSSPRSLKPTIEDEIDEADIDIPPVSEVCKKSERQSAVKKTGREKNTRPKYWLSERTVGEFERRFTFPAGIDQDGVTASLEHGVLKIVVPKRNDPVGRRIDIL
ncbi:hypothetical protein RUND412_009143 [Rhizina undulata]